MTDQVVEPRKLEAHIWAREQHEHYVEPEWCSKRLFEVESFKGVTYDPCCGFGRIAENLLASGHQMMASDIVDRGYPPYGHVPTDFLQCTTPVENVVCNPPFDVFRRFAEHALTVASCKVAMIWLVPRLNAARWLQGTPLARVYLLTPRPSMPPGHTITAGQKPGGGTQDFCWLVWDKAHDGAPELRWLQREAA